MKSLKSVIALVCGLLPVMALAETVFTDQAPMMEQEQGDWETADTEPSVLAIKLGMGFRHEKLDFNIADTNGHPNVLSELKFDMNMRTEIFLSETLNIDALVLNFELSRASAYGGTVRDSDYSGDNRTLEFLRSYAGLKDSVSVYYSLGAGWRFGNLTPMVGYTWIEQDLRIRNGEQVIDTEDHYSGPIPGLDSRYKPRWRGPWVGAQFTLAGSKELDFQLTARHSWFQYRAEADWNLRSDFAHPVSFRHTGKGTGWQLGAEAIWKYAQDQAITLSVDWRQERLRNGTDRTFFAKGVTYKDGTPYPAVLETRLNEVNTKSLGCMLAYRFSF